MNQTKNTHPAVLITGTSTGIGFDAARYLIERGWTIFGSVRRAEDGERIRERLGERFEPLIFDVTDEADIHQAAEVVKEKLAGRPLNGLVNNAGISVIGPLEDIPLSAFRQQFEVNVLGAIAVTQAFLPLLEKPGGRIINISSVSGRIAYPFFSPYAGSKFALEAVSDSMRREFRLHGIDVIVIQPGSVITPIWGKAEEQNNDHFSGNQVYQPSLTALREIVQDMGRNGFPVERVSKTIYTAFTAARPRPRYALPNNWLIGWLAPRFLPTRLVDRAIARALKLDR